MENGQQHHWTSQILVFTWTDFRGKRKRKEEGYGMQNYDSSAITQEKKEILFFLGPLMETERNLAEHGRNKIKIPFRDDKSTSNPASGSFKCYEEFCRH